MPRKKYKGTSLEMPLTLQEFDKHGNGIIDLRIKELIDHYDLDKKTLWADINSPWADFCFALIQDLIPGFQFSKKASIGRIKSGTPKTGNIHLDFFIYQCVQNIMKEKKTSETNARKIYAQRSEGKPEGPIREAQVRASIERYKAWKKKSKKEQSKTLIKDSGALIRNGVNKDRFKRKERLTIDQRKVTSK